MPLKKRGTVAKIVMLLPYFLVKVLHFKDSTHQTHLAQGMAKVK